MTFQDGWIKRQIDLANQEIEKWDEVKREVMCGEPEASGDAHIVQEAQREEVGE